MSGTITQVNEALDGSEDSVNSEPHGAGWLFKIRLSNTGELDELMDAAGYEAFLAEQA